jgi:undecaprenyl-diphosphatase
VNISVLDAIILGLVQGLSEFLPISSTAHLTLSGKLLNLVTVNNSEIWTAFIAVIQLGTMLAVLVYFFNDLVAICKDFFLEVLVKREKFVNLTVNSRLGWLIISGSIPIAIIGLKFRKIIEGTLTKNLWVIATSLIVLAIILAIAEKTAKFKKEIKDITIMDAVLIGFAQSCALVPGASRSGTTITGGLFCGLKRETAARFSFLLSIPAVFASGLLELKESMHFMTHDLMTGMIIGIIVAGISGYVAIDFLLKYLRKNSTFVFVYYRIALGALILALLYFGKIQAI